MGWNPERRAQQLQEWRVSDLHRRERAGIQLDYFHAGDFRRNNVVWNAQWPECACERALAELFQSRRITSWNSELPFGRFEWHAVGRHREWCRVHPFGNDSSPARSAGIVARTNLWNWGRPDRLASDRNGESCAAC